MAKNEYLGLIVGILFVFMAACFAANAVNGAESTAERVLQLPQDENRLHLSIVGSEQDIVRLEMLFRSDDKLMRLKSQVHWHAVATDTAVFRERYKPNVKGLPTVRLQNPGGVVIYEEYGSGVQQSPTAMFNDLTNAMVTSQLFPWRNRGRRGDNRKCGPDGCLPGRCNPFQQPQEEEPEPLEIDPVVVQPEPEPDNTPYMVIVILTALVGAGAGVYAGWRKAHG